jgi:hypothetical protein
MDDSSKDVAYATAQHLSCLIERAMCDAGMPMLVTVAEDEVNKTFILKFPHEVPMARRSEFSRILQQVNEQFTRDRLAGDLTRPSLN